MLLILLGVGMKKIISFILLILIQTNVFGGAKKILKGFFSGGFIGAATSSIIPSSKKDNYVLDYKSNTGSNEFQVKSFDNSQEPDKVYFKDVIGIDDKKEEVMTVVDFLQSPEKYKRLGAKMPKGILLNGPPGNGKTLLARAIANESNCNFFYESGSSFVEVYVGTGAKRVRELFEQARKNKPALIFIDEIDAVGGKRGYSTNKEHDQTLTELLCQLDGFLKDDGIVFIGATNNSKALDKALLRPGRLTKIINIPSPDEKSRYEILEYYVGKLPSVEVGYDYLKYLAEQTLYFSAAELENLINEAALNAVKTNSNMVKEEHLGFALKKVLMRG
jgi:ATP-dependent Zn protease